jgi:cell division protein FtsL
MVIAANPLRQQSRFSRPEKMMIIIIIIIIQVFFFPKLAKDFSTFSL